MQVTDILFGLLDVAGWSLRLVFGLLLLGNLPVSLHELCKRCHSNIQAFARFSV
jgi:hypothetical protein